MRKDQENQAVTPRTMVFDGREYTAKELAALARLHQVRRGTSRATRVGGHVASVMLVVLWLGVTTWFVVPMIATYDVYGSAQSMSVGLCLFTAIGAYLWPPRTPAWRTIAWTFTLMITTGNILLLAGADHWALTVATIAGFLFALGRFAGNSRTIVALTRDWWITR